MFNVIETTYIVLNYHMFKLKINFFMTYVPQNIEM